MNREELAYAGGLFEGEGCVWAKKVNTGGRRTPALRIQMTDREPLDRFAAAVGLGRVRGPVLSPSAARLNKKPIYVWEISGHERSQAVVAMLWSWLGPRRRGRATEILLTCRSGLRPNTPPVRRCSMSGCDRKHKGNGLCVVHYFRDLRARA